MIRQTPMRQVTNMHKIVQNEIICMALGVPFQSLVLWGTTGDITLDLWWTELLALFHFSVLTKDGRGTHEQGSFPGTFSGPILPLPATTTTQQQHRRCNFRNEGESWREKEEREGRKGNIQSKTVNNLKALMLTFVSENGIMRHQNSYFKNPQYKFLMTFSLSLPRY